MCVTNSFLRLRNYLFSSLCETYVFRRYLYPTVFFISPIKSAVQSSWSVSFTLKPHKFSVPKSLIWTYSLCASCLNLRRSPYLIVFFNIHSLLNLINLSDSSIWISITECKIMIDLLSGLPNDRIIKQDPSFFILFSLSFSFHLTDRYFL